MVIAVVAGFVGAALFYSPYVGLNAQSKLACPVCPQVTIVGGTLLARFVRLSIAGGILNAAFFCIVGWVFVVATETLLLRHGGRAGNTGKTKEPG